MIRWRGVAIDRRERTISHRGKTFRFRRTSRKVTFDLTCTLLLAGPKTMAELVDLIYRGQDGGPLGADNAIHVSMRMMMGHYGRLGLALRKRTGCGRNRYWLEPHDG